MDDEIQSLREEMKAGTALAAIFEKRMKIAKKDLALCKKRLHLDNINFIPKNTLSKVKNSSCVEEDEIHR